jgi:hypothetical protein
MKYYNKFTKYSNKLIQIGSSGGGGSSSSSSEEYQQINIFDNITMQHLHTVEKIIESLSMIIYFPEINADGRLQGLKNTLQYPDAWHMPESVTKLTLENIPKSLDELANLYFTAKISEKDRESFISAYRVPFFNTQKELRELYKINKEVMKDTLDQLIISKRIQRLIKEREPFIFNGFITWQPIGSVRRKIPDLDGRLKRMQEELSMIIKKYKSKYEMQEVVIATTWVTAVEKEPLFRDI